MKRKIKNKILSAIAVLAVSATTACAAISFTGCDKNISNVTESQAYSGTTTKISTAIGEIQSRDSGNTYYVSPDGKSTNDGTAESPKDILSILNSLDILKPGDTVLVQPGEYKLATINTNEKITMLVSGSYNNYITVKNADPTKQCVIDFSAQVFSSTNRGVSLYGSYIYWYGIDVCGAGDNGLYIGGNFNTVENCEFYNCRDTGLQLGRSYSEYSAIDQWPSYNLVKNCTSHNNYDNETYGENADGFAAKLTLGYGNVFDGCIAYRNSDDGWDLYAKTDSGNIGAVIMYNCVAYENGYLEYTQRENNKRFPSWTGVYSEADTSDLIDPDNKYGRDSYLTRDGDGNGFKLGGSIMEGDVVLYNCLSFNNRMHGVTDNSNPGVISIDCITSYNNSAMVDDDPQSEYFGYILDVANSDTHANIDLARQIYSYNNLSRVLSIKDDLALSLDVDAYRGSVTDSILLSKRIEGSIDADTKNEGGDSGDNARQPESSEIFTELPFTKTVPDVEGGEVTYNFNITGLKDLYAEDGTSLNPNRAHKKYRNLSDGSINMGDILDVKDYSVLFGNENKIGSKLNLSSYEEYKHFFTSDFTDKTLPSEDAAIVARTKETLTLNCDPDAVYQDFDIPTKMSGKHITIDSSGKDETATVKIEWATDNENYLKLNKDKKDISVSKSEYIMAEVYRPLDEDVKVKLTATISYGTATDTKEFTLTIKAGKPKIGEIYVKTADGETIYDNGVLILDHYLIFEEPEVYVENGLDYHNKLLSEDLYNITTTYKYTSDKTMSTVTIAGFTPSNAGVYTVTKTVTMKDDPSQYGVMSYTVYVASPYADVDFMEVGESKASISVNRYGYVISGEMSNATGKVYAVSSPTELNLTEANKENIKTADGVKSYDFRGDNVSFQFENANNGEYFIYYLVANLNDEVKSELYSTKINVVDISSESDFMKVAGGESLGEEDPSRTIYQLTKDLDFHEINWKGTETAFRGLINGKGHTVKNLSVVGTSVFYKVDGGTIMNIKFNEVNINSEKPKTGLISECTGGYFYNIQMNEINVSTKDQRAGGLIGHVNVGTPVNIEQVSINNTKEDYKIQATQRVGGLIGFSQAGSSNASGNIDITITNCLVNAHIYGDYELGGIFGNYDCGNNKNCTYSLNISSSVFTGIVESVGSKSYAAGILGYQKGAYAVMRIENCISVGHIYFNENEVETALKNCSGIVGSSTTLMEGLYAYVSECNARMEEYNSNYDVSAWNRYAVLASQNYKNKLDMEKWTLVVDESIPDSGYGPTLKAPYVTLNFLGEWNTAE